jgi:PAS domain S-box-containing protein
MLSSFGDYHNASSGIATNVDFATIVEDDTDGIAVCDGAWRFVYVNAAIERMTDLSRSDLLGRSVSQVWPQYDSSAFEPIRQAMVERKETITRFASATHPDQWREVRCVPVTLGPEKEEGLIAHWRDITQARQIELARDEAVQYAMAAVRAVDSVQDAYLTLDADFRIKYANEGASRINHKPVSDFLGNTIWDEWPSIVDTPLAEAYLRSQRDRKDEYLLHHYFVTGQFDVWLELNMYPDEVGGGLHVAYRDITRRVRREQREKFLAELSDRTSVLNDPDAIIAEVTRSVGKFLVISRCMFSDIDLEADVCTVHTDYCDENVASIAGEFPLSIFGRYVTEEFAAGRAVVVNDVCDDPQKVPAETVDTYTSIGIRAYVAVPFIHTNRLVSTISVHSAAPRVWIDEEVDLLRKIVERTWLITEVARQHNALVEEVKQRREIARRQAQFTSLVQNSTDFIGIADLGGYKIFINDAGRQLVGLPVTDHDEFKITKLHTKDFLFPEDLDYMVSSFLPQVMSEGQAVTEVRFRHFETGDPIWMDFSEFVLRDQETAEITSLMMIAREIGERKRQEAARERLQLRERNIADQLQEALLPATPEHVPGMAVRGFYRAALQEAGVGGDFADCYSCGGGSLTCFVVADVSGKGLRAASQVATIRNMLRYAMHENERISTAVAQLNRVLIEQERIEGFATLLAGTFDPVTRNFTYVNCGQEPALIWRAATQQVEQLSSTGSVIGAYIEAEFQEQSVTLSPGDVLALFTDGLTEAGPNRTNLLSVDGLASLLRQSAESAFAESPIDAAAAASSIVEKTIAAVEEFAGGPSALTDDIVFLVGVVTGETPPFS